MYSFLFLLHFTLFAKSTYLPPNNYNINVKNLLRKQISIHAIPKKIHQIWVGKNLMHPACIRAMKTWKKFHPDWEYKLWTDKDIETFEWTNRALFDALDNPGAKADVWRYEILNKYGGLYVDVDFVCLKPFDLFHEKLSFYSGFIGKFSEKVIANGLFGCCPNHPILEGIITSLSKADITNSSLSEDEIMSFTGPYFFTKFIKDYLPHASNIYYIEKNAHIFPPAIFYPIEPIYWELMHHNNLNIPKSLKKKTKNSYAVHLYARSWCE